MPSQSDLLAAKKSMSRRYLTKAAPPQIRTFALAVPLQPAQNVVGVGVGIKISEGKETDTIAVRFYVERKIAKEALSPKNLLPAEIDGVPTDVIVTGKFRMLGTAEDNKKRRRPVRPGTSVGFKFPHPKENFVMAGTFGAVATKSGKRFILSNNHVLAENGLITLGSPIFQPGLLDGGIVNSDQVATLSDMIPIKPTGFNKVDCALAEFLPGIQINARHMPRVGKLTSTTPIAAANGMLIEKTGRTTGYTRGRVVDVAADINVPYEDPSGIEFIATFADQIVVVGTPPGSFSDSGDSGSLIVDRKTKRPTGLLFAGSNTHTIANHISDVLSTLRVKLETA